MTPPAPSKNWDGKRRLTTLGESLMRRPTATAACSPGASISRRQHLQQLGSLGLLATGSLSSLHALTAQAQDSQLPLHVLLIGNANYQRNAVLRNPARDVQLLAQAFGARCAGCNGRLTTCRHG